jgi:hypothetical protein
VPSRVIGVHGCGMGIASGMPRIVALALDSKRTPARRDRSGATPVRHSPWDKAVAIRSSVAATAVATAVHRQLGRLRFAGIPAKTARTCVRTRAVLQEVPRQGPAKRRVALPVIAAQHAPQHAPRRGVEPEAATRAIQLTMPPSRPRQRSPVEGARQLPSEHPRIG